MRDENVSMEGGDRAVDERRAFPRVSQACAVSYRPLDASAEGEAPETPAVMNNISGGGICFTVEEPLDVGKMLALEVQLPGFPANVISMGKVAWCAERADGGDGWDVGVEFWWIGWEDESAQNQIRRYITQALRES